MQEPKALYYLKYDNDIVIQKNNWLSALVTVIDAIPELGAIGYNFEPVSYPLKLLREYKIRVKEEGNIGGACFLIPKRTEDILGYWCEDYGFYGFEDVDYSFRIKLTGLLNAYIEDEEIGIHLPAGRAVRIDARTWRGSDGIEEVDYKTYRDFKDLELRENIISGIVEKTFNEYVNKMRPLYIRSNLSLFPTTSSIQVVNDIVKPSLSESNVQQNLMVLRVDIGCGANKPDNFIGVDICPSPGVDIVADLNKKFPFEDNSVCEVRAHDIIEHLPDKIHTMNEIWRICKSGANVDIRVPSTDGRGAFQDPTHVSFWNINSFLYYCVDFSPYLELCRKYGFIGAFKVLKLEHEESPDRVIHVRAELSVVKSQMQLILDRSLETNTTDSQVSLQKFPEKLASETLADNDTKEGIYQLSNYVEQYQQDPNNRVTIANLRQARKQVADQLLCLSANQLESAYLGELGKAYKILLNSCIKDEPLTDTEQTFVAEFSAHISKGFDEPGFFYYLLVATLYRRADQLPSQYDFSRIPKWFLNDYLKFTFDSPLYFREVGEAEIYYHYMQRWIDYLHISIFSAPDSALWRDIATYFLRLANFIPLYFNKFTLRDIYVKRAEILEFALKLADHEIDYEFTEEHSIRKKIRLGILAAHFTPTAETFATLPIYEYLSRDFEVILYSLTSNGHRLEQYCQSCANSFKLLPKDLADQVNLIRADDLDILFIATNVTAVTNQICLLSLHRLARVQVTSVGSVVTTGIRHIDYYISGQLTDPSADAEQHYKEKLVKLEGTAHCFSFGSEIEKATVKVDRESLGISEETVVFISGANFFTIIPELIDVWVKILAAVPNSVLVLLPFGPNWSNAYPKKAFLNRLSTVFSEHGIAVDRLLVLDPQPVPNREDVKEYFKIADVYLDSYPFSGTTSLIEPLEVGLPIIAIQGTCFRSAMGAAMLQALNAPDLVADNDESYVQLAIALGTNPELRKQKSAEIKQRMQANPSFLDSRSYSAKIGTLFQELLQNYQAIALTDSLKLRATNLIIFPDWSQSEDILYQDLASVITNLVNHPDKNQMTLLISTGSLSEDEANLLLSDVVMNLFLEEDLDVTDGPEISLLDQLSEMQWQALLPQIQAKIVLEKDRQVMLITETTTGAAAKVENIPVLIIDGIIHKDNSDDTTKASY